MFCRPSRFCAPLFAVLVSMSAMAQNLGPFDSPDQAEPIHYYNGDIRVERLVALDEVVVTSRTGAPVRAEDFALPGLSSRATGPSGDRVVVRLDVPAAGRAGLNGVAAALAGPDRVVQAVAFAPGAPDRSDAHRETITDRLSVKPRDSARFDALLREFELEIVRTVGSAYVVRVNHDDPLAAVDIANALYESGEVEFATPLIERQQQTRLIPDDPLFPDQWHLNNTGQVSGAVVGHDANIIEVWDTYTGDGVNIAITDSGVQVAHPDLAANARTDIDIDINGNDDDPTPQSDSHGTAVAGIAAAVGNNAAGVTGAAFDAGIVGIRLIEAATTDAEEAEAMAHQIDPETATDRVHINNNSWGPFDTGNQLATFGPLTHAALIDGVTLGRGGLGVVYVWAGGNGRQSNDNVNYDGYASSRYTIAVGASGGNGVVSYYSEPGASLLVNAPSSYDSVGTTTTTRTANGTYTSTFGGTSSAAPLAAGSVALVLEARPQLGWRDVQHILVDTAFQNQPGSGGWVANGSGRLFHHDYGYGRVDTMAAVARSLDWVNVDAATTLDSAVKTVNAAIPDNNSAGITRTHTFSEVPAGFFVEHVEVILNTSHNRGGDLRIELTSPAGMKSVLATTNTSRSANYASWKFTSKAHWGEHPGGTWSLKLADQAALQFGTWNHWRLIVHGFVIESGCVTIDAGHTGHMNGHPNWPFNAFQDGYDAVDSGGTLKIGSDLVLGEPATLSKPVTIQTSGAAVRLSVD